jgi:hypothetical protein
MGDSCTSGVELLCDQSGAAVSRYCICGANNQWACIPLTTGAGGAGGGGGAGGAINRGGAGGVQTTTCAGVASGDGCNVATDLLCDRSDSTNDPRWCVCDGSGQWVCVTINAGGGTGGTGAGGVSAGGAATAGTAGAAALSTCIAGVATGSVCIPAVDTAVCDRSTSATNPRTCTCNPSNNQWVCTPVGTGGAGGGG